ncbi:bifunctional DNA-formamidopyrimidine glycosylase/DNA-(apurinic or apyrimidinic site) lyase [Rhodobium gokarnense]|uniref:Formamidopyrimidine-DNA glycosylase n=1 Tax=Rhodobium gokarnense TaxID=364296 RepID=A0ABT3HI32_9HYPH|nr:bifunctional DNA-formamidopyrimidine glycosylase/DNA-(apurinic or apyrimidinic site) lyase [Rhodobium gokarnense]MCW2310065.1 formamidopyrimidine-DNA glycosylase [Rhodobium gokarnense]
MPELPEVETVRRGLQPAMEGARIVRVEQRRPDLRFPFPTDFVDRLTGQAIVSLGRRAKYLLADLSSGDVLIMHLGMSGSFRVETPETALLPGSFHMERSKSAAHDHVVFHLAGPGAPDGTAVIYNDPRRFGFMTLCPRAELHRHPFFAGLGPEPTGNSLDAATLAAACWHRKTSLKAALLDQRIIAGLGNIYVCEALWRAGLSPKRSASCLATKAGAPSVRAERLVVAIRETIADAIAAGGSSLRDYVHADGSLGYFQHSFSVYDREGTPCRHEGCTGTVRRIVQSGRSSFFCPTCQR